MTKRHYYKKEIVSTNFISFGEIQFKPQQLLQNPTLRIENVDGQSYGESDFVLQKMVFFANIKEQGKNDACRNSESLSHTVIWPGKLLKSSKGVKPTY